MKIINYLIATMLTQSFLAHAAPAPAPSGQASDTSKISAEDLKVELKERQDEIAERKEAQEVARERLNEEAKQIENETDPTKKQELIETLNEDQRSFDDYVERTERLQGDADTLQKDIIGIEGDIQKGEGGEQKQESNEQPSQ